MYILYILAVHVYICTCMCIYTQVKYRTQHSFDVEEDVYISFLINAHGLGWPYRVCGGHWAHQGAGGAVSKECTEGQCRLVEGGEN